MKKRNTLLMILIPIFFIGIIFIIIGVALGGTLYSYRLATDSNEEGYTSEPTILSTDEAKKINAINWSLRASDTIVTTGDSYKVSGSAKYRSYVEDGVWHIETPEKYAYVTFLNHRLRIPFIRNKWFFSNIVTDELTIQIPAQKALGKATIKVSTGSLNGDALTADTVTLKIGAGESLWDKIIAKHLSVKVGAGSSTMNRLNISESCTAVVSAGDLNLGNEDMPAGTNTITSLKGKCAIGDMSVTGKLLGTSQLQCTTGNIDVLLDGYYSNYHFKQNSSLGDIDIDSDESRDDDWDDDWDEDWDEDWDDWDEPPVPTQTYTTGHHPEHHDSVISAPPTPTQPASDKTDSSHFGDISLKCSLGDISVEFQN